MLGHPGKGNLETGGQAGDGSLAEGELGEDGAARGIREGRKGGVQERGRILNHTV